MAAFKAVLYMIISDVIEVARVLIGHKVFTNYQVTRFVEASAQLEKNQEEMSDGFKEYLLDLNAKIFLEKEESMEATWCPVLIEGDYSIKHMKAEYIKKAYAIASCFLLPILVNVFIAFKFYQYWQFAVKRKYP